MYRYTCLCMNEFQKYCNVSRDTGTGHFHRFPPFFQSSTSFFHLLLRARPFLFHVQAEVALQTLHDKQVLHRDVKPDNFLMHGDVLQLNDFDVSCLRHDLAQRVIRPVGTCEYWSPRCDIHNDSGWLYDEADDWMGLALTFAFWLGTYAARQSSSDNVQVKVGAVRMLLALRSAPEALKARIRPVVDLIAGDVWA